MFDYGLERIRQSFYIAFVIVTKLASSIGGVLVFTSVI